MRRLFPIPVAVAAMGFAASLSAQQPPVAKEVVLTLAEAPVPSAARSEGFTLTEVSFDASATIDRPERFNGTGVVLASHTPRNVWHGERPAFVPPRIAGGAPGELLPLTDVIEVGDFLYAHYGPDHYQTRKVVVVDANRHEVLHVDASAAGDISRVLWEPDTGTLYFTVVEGNIGEADRARLHAYSVKEGKPLWATDPATAHGGFLVYGDHILCHYGFTDQDDFVNVVDKGSGEVLEKHRVATAASALIPSGDTILAPCYTGVVQFTFEEE